jgi:hypothetical protein
MFLAAAELGEAALACSSGAVIHALVVRNARTCHTIP